MPLNFTVLVPCVAPKFIPVIVTGVPTDPELGFKLLTVGPTVNGTPLLACVPTVTTTFPVVAPVGTFTTMLVLLQLVYVVTAVPLNVTALLPCVAPKFVPVIVTAVPTAPELGFRLVIPGAGVDTVKATPLLACVPTVTTTFPVVAPVGTVTAILVSLQLVAVAVVR